MEVFRKSHASKNVSLIQLCCSGRVYILAELSTISERSLLSVD